MGAHRTDMHRLQELVRLHRLGRSRRDVARLLGMGRDTIRQYEAALAAAGLLDGPEAELPSLEALGEAVRVLWQGPVDSATESITTHLQAAGLPNVRVTPTRVDMETAFAVLAEAGR